VDSVFKARRRLAELTLEDEAEKRSDQRKTAVQTELRATRAETERAALDDGMVDVDGSGNDDTFDDGDDDGGVSYDNSLPPPPPPAPTPTLPLLPSDSLISPPPPGRAASSDERPVKVRDAAIEYDTSKSAYRVRVAKLGSVTPWCPARDCE